jgi:hypothetical protein
MSASGLHPEFDGSIFTKTEPSNQGSAQSNAPAHSAARPDMPEGVLDGRLGEICQRRLNRSPLAFAWPALIATAGAQIPRSQQVVRSNIYSALVGPVGSGKTQTLQNASSVLGLREPLLIEGKYGSAEGLVDALQDVEPNAVRLYAVDELSHLLAKCAIDRASFPSILNSAYSYDCQRGGTKKARFVFDCRLSLTGGLVEDQFGDSFGMATIGGLYDRFVFGLCPQPFEYLYRPFEGSPEPTEPIGALVNPEIWEARDQMITEGVPGRVAEQAIKFAYICACFDGRPSLRVQELGPALAFAKYQTRVRLLLQPNPGENPDARCAFSVRKWLAANAPNGDWVSRRVLHRGIHADRFGPGAFNRCLQNLQFNDELELDGKAIRLLPTD